MSDIINVTVVSLTDIREDPDLQMREAGVDAAVVAEYTEALKTGVEFPPVVLYHDSDGNYWPGDGFHRIAAAKRIDKDTIRAEVREGSRRDALLCAAGANASHGIRRTQADKRRAVERLLTDAEWARWSDRKVAEVAKVDHKTVAKIRRELSGEIPTTKLRGEIPTANGKANNRGSLLQDLIRGVTDDALIGECQRRGLTVHADV